MCNKFVYEKYNPQYYNQILIHYLSTSFFKLNLISSLTQSPSVAPVIPITKAPARPAARPPTLIIEPI